MKFLNLRALDYGYFIPRALRLFALEKGSVILFFVLASLAALSEGMSMALIVPLLESQVENSRFAAVPIIGTYLTPLDTVGKPEALILISSILGVVIVLRGVVQFGAQSLNVSIPLRLQCVLTQQAYNALVQARIGFIDSKDFGDLYTNVREHAQRVSAALNGVISIFFSLALMAAYIVVMLALSVEMTLVSLLFVGVVGIAIKLFLIRPLKDIGRDLSSAQTMLHGQFLDTLSGMRLIHLRAAENIMMAKYKEALDRYYHSDRRRLVISVLQSPLIMTISGVFICVLIAVNAVFSEPGDVSWISSLLVFVMCLYRMLSPTVMLNNARATIAGNAHSMEALDDFLNEATASIQKSGLLTFNGLGGDGIRVENVSFHYDGAERAALHNVSFHIQPRKMVALVGPSGAGKSSIIGILTRFYDPQEGRVVIGGLDAQEYDVRSLRRCISVVSQKTVLFNDTIMNNLTFGLGKMSQKRVEEAAHFAAAYDFINALPDGYETVVGEHGARLSGGQQQRLAIARAFLSRPELLILDEATNQLDSITEQVIQKAVEEFRRDTTVVVVAHRLSTIQKADTIVVLDHGQIVEQGNHKTLMRHPGLYRTMVEQQQFDTFSESENQSSLQEQTVDER